MPAQAGYTAPMGPSYSTQEGLAGYQWEGPRPTMEMTPVVCSALSGFPLGIQGREDLRCFPWENGGCPTSH